MYPTQWFTTSFRRKLRFHTALVGLICLCMTVAASAEEYSGIYRALSSPTDQESLNEQLSNENLQQLLAILEGKQTEIPVIVEAITERASVPATNTPTILPELIRVHEPISTTTTEVPTTEKPPVSRVTTRRLYRRLRRKPTSTELPSATPTPKDGILSPDTGSGRMLPAAGAGPQEILQQISLLTGILGALNSTSQPAAAPLSLQQNAPALALGNNNFNANKDNASAVNDILALLTGAKSEASTKSEVVVAPPPQAPSKVDDNTASALALLNLFNTENKDNQPVNTNNAANLNLLNLVAQSQQQPPASASGPDTDAAAALTKLLLQNSVPATQAMQSNSIVQPQQQQQSADSANQLTSLLGLLGTLGAASGGGLQPQSNSGGINNLFNLGADQQAAQAQQMNSLASLFGGGQQLQQQQNAQNLLSLFGGNNANQGFSLASLLAPQGNSIPGLGLLSTMSSLGTSILSTVSNIFAGNKADGKPRVRGKGVDTRLGLGYRLGNVGDAQIVWDIGPQLFTDPLKNEMRPYTKKRESPMQIPYSDAASAASVEKQVQQMEAKRRMVQSAIQDHYRNDYSQFPGVYPTNKFRRSHNYFDYTTTRPYYYTSTSTSTTPAPTASSVFFRSIPFVDHIKGFWSGLTSGLYPNEETDTDTASSSPSPSYNFDDIRTDFSTNLIKRSSPDYTDYESRKHKSQRRMDDYDADEAGHSTLTDYERMLLQYGKDMGVGGVADTRHGVVDEPRPSESSNIFARWFKPPTPTASKSRDRDEEESYRRGESGQRSEWGPGSTMSGSEEYPVIQKHHHQTIKKTSPYEFDGSYSRRNEAGKHSRRSHKKKNSRPQQRRSHNPFRNWFSAFKSSGSNHHHHHGQRPRASQHSHYAGFGRRHYKRPSGNPKLQHFTNMNKDLMMADANNDDFVESAGRESIPGMYDQPLTYNYASEFPDVPLTLPPKRLRPSEVVTLAGYHSKLRQSQNQHEQTVKAGLLFDHLDDVDTKEPSEADESFHNRNKVVVNPKLREMEKKKVLGTAASPGVVTKIPVSLSKLQQMRLQKLRANGTAGGKQKIIVKVKGKGTSYQYKPRPVPPAALGESEKEEEMPESSTALPSVLSTISSIFSGTTKPKLFPNFLQNATSFLPSISSIRILPRKKNKGQKTKLTLHNGKPTIVSPPEEDLDLDAEGDEPHPVVQVGEDMSFTDLQTLFGASKRNNTKRRFRIRVKESVLKGDDDDAGNNDKERKDSEEDTENDETRDVFVDIESGEVSVLKPVASLVSFAPKKEEPEAAEEIDYYEDDDGDGVADADMNRKEYIFEAIQKQLVKNFEKMKKAELKAAAKQRRKEQLAQQGMDESIDVVTKLFNVEQPDNAQEGSSKQQKVMQAGGLPL